MFNVYALEYLMTQQQQSIDNEARHAWKWMNPSEKASANEVKIIQPSVVCCQPVCC